MNDMIGRQISKSLDKIADALKEIVKTQNDIKKQNADILKELRLQRAEREINEGF